LVSTNVDGLHRRAGSSADKLAELHGNCYKEYCPSCLQENLRRFDVGLGRKDHKTARSCETCKVSLKDTIIHFGENLPDRDLNLTAEQASLSDVALVLGTSMRVQPACNFPSKALKNRGKMIIVNLQKTPYDKYASLIIRARTDHVMELLTKELGLSVPKYDEEEDVIKNM